MDQSNAIICAVFFVLTFFTCVETYFNVPSRVYLPITNLTVISEAERRNIDNWFREYPVKFDIKRVRELPAEQDIKQSIVLDFIGLVQKHDEYTPEEFTVTTEDRYNLVLHRISGSPLRPKKQGRPVVYIQPGLFMSSDCFVLLGPKKDLAFILSEAGFDVWIGNPRGNTYSRSHETLLPNESKFWDFSFHEIGKYDIKATINKIISETGVKTLDFIGYQLGATEGYIYLTENPYDTKPIRLFINISPFAYWKNNRLCEFNSIPYIRKEIMLTTYSEIYPQSTFMGQILYNKHCEVFGDTACYEITKSFSGYGADINKALFPNVMKYFPAGVSKKTILHLLQNIESGRFAQFDDNYNRQIDSNFTDTFFLPNEYDLSRVSVPTVIFNQISHECFIRQKDYDRLLAEIPNVVLNTIFENIDILWPTTKTMAMYDYLVDLLKRFDDSF